MRRGSAARTTARLWIAPDAARPQARHCRSRLCLAVGERHRGDATNPGPVVADGSADLHNTRQRDAHPQPARCGRRSSRSPCASRSSRPKSQKPCSTPSSSDRATPCPVLTPRERSVVQLIADRAADSSDRGLRRLDANLYSARGPIGMAGAVNPVTSQTEIAKTRSKWPRRSPSGLSPARRAPSGALSRPRPDPTIRTAIDLRQCPRRPSRLDLLANERAHGHPCSFLRCAAG